MRGSIQCRQSCGWYVDTCNVQAPSGCRVMRPPVRHCCPHCRLVIIIVSSPDLTATQRRWASVKSVRGAKCASLVHQSNAWLWSGAKDLDRRVRVAGDSVR
jgi:hypothetical protein